ncbi:MAG: MerR family transcriptional regulator [bacterium]|nr:MerR family transcriptional regulator [bacterium]
MSDLPNYLTIKQLMSLADVTKVQLAYYSKLGLIPPAIKRKYDGEMIGHYPSSTVKTLEEIKEMKNKGISVSDMKFFNKTLPAGRQAIIQSPIPNFQLIFSLIIFSVGILFGFLLGFGKSNQNFKNLAVGSDPVYLMTLDNQPKNFYKLGTVNLQQ